MIHALHVAALPSADRLPAPAAKAALWLFASALWAAMRRAYTTPTFAPAASRMYVAPQSEKVDYASWKRKFDPSAVLVSRIKDEPHDATYLRWMVKEAK